MADLSSSYLMNYEKFFGKNVIEFAQNEIQEDWIESADGEIHLDIFTKDIEAPTIDYSHVMSG